MSCYFWISQPGFPSIWLLSNTKTSCMSTPSSEGHTDFPHLLRCLLSVWTISNHKPFSLRWTEWCRSNWNCSFLSSTQLWCWARSTRSISIFLSGSQSSVSRTWLSGLPEWVDLNRRFYNKSWKWELWQTQKWWTQTSLWMCSITQSVELLQWLFTAQLHREHMVFSNSHLFHPLRHFGPLLYFRIQPGFRCFRFLNSIKLHPWAYFWVFERCHLYEPSIVKPKKEWIRKQIR